VSKTRDNHIVPKSYLASWAGFNREDTIRCRDLKSYDPSKVIRRHAKAICYEPYYYPQRIEDLLQREIETPASQLWPTLDKTDIKLSDRKVIARFIAYQSVRSAESIDKLHTLSIFGSGRDNLIIPFKLLEDMDPRIALGRMRNGLDQVAETLAQRNWTVLDFGGNWCIETSDSPVCFGHNDQKLVDGFLPEELVVFPLTPNRVLQVDQSRPFGYSRKTVLPGMSKSINDLVRHWARRFIIMPPR